jgi:hypothetical protein
VTDSTGTPSTPAGWYADPAGSDRLRWWDGTRWTDHLTDAPTAGGGHSVSAAAGAPSSAADRPHVPPVVPPAHGQQAQGQPAYGQQAPQPYSQQPYSQAGYGQQAYAAPTPPPRVPASTSPHTWAIWVLAALPVVSLILITATDFRAALPANPYDRPSMMPGAGYLATQLLGFLLYGAGVVVAYLDWRDLGRRGFVRPFHWAWTFLGSGVYVIGRSIIVRRRIEGSPNQALAPIWLWAGISAIVFFAFLVKWVDAFMAVMQRYGTPGY